MTAGTDLIAAERQRQIDTEGGRPSTTTPTRDSNHQRRDGLLRGRSQLPRSRGGGNQGDSSPDGGPGPRSGGTWTSIPSATSPRPGALIAAEIDRLIRAAGGRMKAIVIRQPWPRWSCSVKNDRDRGFPPNGPMRPDGCAGCLGWRSNA